MESGGSAAPGEVGSRSVLSWFPLHVGMALALFVTALDELIAQLVAKDALPLHPAFGALLPFVLLAYLAAWLLVGWPLVRIFRLGAEPLALALAALLLAPASVLTLSGFVDGDAMATAFRTQTGQLQLAVLGTLGLALAVLLQRVLVTGGFPERALRVLSRAAMAAPVVVFALAATVWWRRTPGVEIAPLDLVPFLAFAAAAGLVAWRASSARPLLAAIYVTAAVAVVAPALVSELAPAASGPPPLAADASANGPPLVLLLSVDSLRRDALSVYSAQAPDTPTFDRLAADGLVYDAAVAPAPWTLPSLASVLTGLPETVHGTSFQHPRLPGPIPTLAQHLAAAGYRTAAIGSNPWLEPSDLGRGFERVDFFPQALQRSVGSTSAGALLDLPDRIDPDTVELTDLALAWLEATAGTPRFLWLHYFDPHSPYGPPVELIEGGPEGRVAFDQAYGVMIGSVQTSRADKARIRALYDAEVRLVDQQLSRIVAELEAQGIYEESLVFVISDHGEEFWDHDTGFHGHTLFEEMIGVPLILKPPARSGIGAGRVARRVSTGSVHATLLAMAGLRVAGAEDFYPALPLTPVVAAAPGSEAIVSTGTIQFERRQSLILGDHKLVLHLDSDRRQLYDLAEDPGERCDLASHDGERVAELTRLLDLHTAKSLDARRSLGLVSPDPAQVPAAVREQLEALGYAK